MNWIKRLFGIKEVEPKTNEIKMKPMASDYYASIDSALKHVATPNDIVVQRKNKQIKTNVIDGYEIAKQRRAREFAETARAIRQKQEDESSFLTSMAVAAVTDSTVVGALGGGDILGAIVGDALNDNDSNSSSDSSDSGFDGGFGGGDFSGGGSGGSWDDSSSSSSDSYDSSSSYDSDSSYDSSDSSSSDW